MKILIAGASGLIGNALASELAACGHEVRRLVRRAPTRHGEFCWNPAAGEIAADGLAGVDAIINLAGENIAAGRWTTTRREAILRSRVDATRTLVTALDRMASRPAVFLNASAVGIYGDRGDEILRETSAMGHGFLPEVCLAWETHAEGAARRGVRTVMLRFGVVLAREGGALAKMRPAFRAGLGGRLGAGTQWMSWVSLADAVGAICHGLTHEDCRGPFNIVAPEPVTNATFTAALGRAWHRPTLLPVPAWVLRLIFGEMADGALLASTRAVPAALAKSGFTFRHPTLAEALAAVKL